MEQRPLRLGDLVDDYCPRERRVTNHAIVAIVNDAIRQTRCTTCDAEHVFKGAKPPRRRPLKPDGVPTPPADGTETTPPAVTAAADRELVAASQSVDDAGQPMNAAGQRINDDEPVAADETADREQDAWPANRQLIRATLPRSEGDQPPPRPIPEFTIYQRHNTRGRGFQFGSRWSGNGNGNGNGNGHGDRRGGPNGQQPQGGQGHGRRRHGKKRPPR